MDTTGGHGDDPAKAARWAELREHWRVHGPPGALRSGYRDAIRTTPAVHERTGERVGRHDEHWSGRVDATAERVELIPNPALTYRPKEAPE